VEGRNTRKPGDGQKRTEKMPGYMAKMWSCGIMQE
jgi:hypothetical protein